MTICFCFNMPLHYKVSNIVATCNLRTTCTLNLRHLALRARNVEYNPKRFSALVMRIHTPRSTCLIFSTGRIVVVGTRTEPDAYRATRRFAYILHKLDCGVARSITSFTIQNIVASLDYGARLPLERIAFCFPQFCIYEPEIFPGLTFRVYFERGESVAKNKRSVSLLVFKSGKVVVVGANACDQIDKACEHIERVFRPLLLKH